MYRHDEGHWRSRQSPRGIREYIDGVRADLQVAQLGRAATRVVAARLPKALADRVARLAERSGRTPGAYLRLLAQKAASSSGQPALPLLRDLLGLPKNASLEECLAMVQALFAAEEPPPPPDAVAADPTPPATAARGLTARERSYCQRTGCTPAALEARKASAVRRVSGPAKR
jgi:putative hemolysin